MKDRFQGFPDPSDRNRLSLLELFTALANRDCNEPISVEITARKIKIGPRGHKWLGLVFFLKRHHSTNILLSSASSVSKDLFSNTWFLQGVLLEATDE